MGKPHIMEVIAKRWTFVIAAKAAIQKTLILKKVGFPDQVGE